MPVTTETSKLVKFYGDTRATEAFLRTHHVYYYRQTGNHCLVAEQLPGQEPRVYLLGYGDDLRLLPTAELATAFRINDTSAASLQKFPLATYSRYDQEPVAGSLVFRLFSSESYDTISYHAHTTALDAGATNATARWFSDFVDFAFAGLSMRAYDYQVQLTDEGMLLTSSEDKTFPDTPKRQLRKLQNLHLLEFAPVRGLPSVRIKFNRSKLNGFRAELLPDFLQTVFY
ncbi:hypothetical protein ACFPAF_17125 [Hymenobacter endophyticus]|uniref:Uncharacterized protein n=1 Tax=Hymenobacter endophyticus TaxID=3076335 RepID=A0ABU3TL87_9BACT|nr:hypothetical protein [Hymenobacter endophyticus]MDU0372128.1 hypothetical protein [Hymenobacter endophyticus]